MSELDERRREYLAEYFLQSTQAVISTTNLEYFDEEILSRTRIIRISGGSILETATNGATR
jgi:DNA replication and repair protein RecF